MNKVMNYVIIPRDIEDGSKIIEKIYNQFCIISILKEKHFLIPPLVFKKIAIKELIDKTPLPLEFSEEEILLLEMYSGDELESRNDREKLIPIPFLNEELFVTYKDIALKLSNYNKWIFQLIDFFKFLSDEGFRILANVEPDDFLYNSDGSVKYFIGFNNLLYTAKDDTKSISNFNLDSLASLLNKYYLKDTENYEAHLYHQKWFKKIENRLIEPFLYNQYSVVTYSSFDDIINDLQGKMIKRVKKYRIGVFLDTANIMTPLYNQYSIMEIDFDKLFNTIYGRDSGFIISRKQAVIFLPNYQGQAFSEMKYRLIFEIKDYLESYGFEIFTVENDQAAAKELVDGVDFDIDDIKLIDLMENALNELDGILLFTGDRHFYDIAEKYKLKGKTVKLISVSEENTSDLLIREFDHSFIYKYWNCIKSK